MRLCLVGELSTGLGKTPKDPRGLWESGHSDGWAAAELVGISANREASTVSTPVTDSSQCCTPRFLIQLQGMAVSPLRMVGGLSAYWPRLLLRLLEF